ncbi:hypothetical protein PGO15_04360 [Klebsiella aerogenes]
MGVKDSEYQIIYRGEVLRVYCPGGWVIFQRDKECGGGYWVGRTFDGVYLFECEHPVSLFDAIGIYMCANKNEPEKKNEGPNFSLFD